MVPDAELLFTGSFRRAGPDLVLTGHDGRHHLIPGYFASEHHAALMAPNGASLSADVVDLLAGSPTPGHYAQAQPTTPPAPPAAIGKVEKAVGDCTVTHNGVAVTLHVGDAVFKSDVVQTGASSSLGISFPDGTALDLVANTRMALNDYAYDPNSNSNSALMTLVEGTFAFVAGKVAHTGDMKIATPVATMGIRGTTGIVEQQPGTITSNLGQLAYSFAVVPDFGTTANGAYTLCYTDPVTGACQVFTTVAQTGYETVVTPQGAGLPPAVSIEPLTAAQFAFEQAMTQELFQLLTPLNPNPNGTNGSSTQPQYQELNPNPQQYENNGTPLYILPPDSGPILAGPPNVQPNPDGPTAVVVWLGGNGNWDTATSWSDGFVASSISLVEVLSPVTVTVSDGESAGGLVVENGAVVDIVNGGTLEIFDEITGNGTVELDSTGSDPTLAIAGKVTLQGGGTILMTGTPGDDSIVGATGSGAKLVNVDDTITGGGTIGHNGDGELTLVNQGTIDATGLMVIDTGNLVTNEVTTVTVDGVSETTSGLMEATAGGTLQIEDSVSNGAMATIEATGAGATVSLSGASLDNSGTVMATADGTVAISGVAVTNESGADMTATLGGTLSFVGGSLTNDSMIEAESGGILQFTNLTVDNGAAGEVQVGVNSFLDLANAGILGGTIDNAGSVVVTGAAVLHGDVVTNEGDISVGSSASLTLQGDTTLLNEAGGVIDADGGAITIALTNAANVNSGTIQAENGGSVTFDIDVQGGSNHGLIEAGAGGTISFVDNSGGGDRGGEGGSGGNYGTMEAIDGGVLTFNGGLDNFGLVQAVDGGVVHLNEGVDNHADGTIAASGTGALVAIADGYSENADTIIAENGGTITFASVLLSNDAGAMVEATGGGAIDYDTGGITNDGTFKADGGTMSFSGEIGITNEADGVFLATNDGAITFGSSGIGSVTNDGGLIEATNGGIITFAASLNGAENEDGGIVEAGAGGTVVIDDFGKNGFSNTGGVIEALGLDAKVELDGATIIGGTVESAGGGVIETVGGANAFLNVTLAGADVAVEAATSLHLQGTTTIDGTVTLEGGGTVELDETSYKVVAGSAGAVLDNDTTIEGSGTIGSYDQSLTLNNEAAGVIDATGQLNIATGTNVVENAGLMEATGTGNLIIFSAVDNTGTILAADRGFVSIDGGVNQGLIKARDYGDVSITSLTEGFSNLAGGTIEADGSDATVTVSVNVAAGGGSLISNAGQIVASGGSVFLTEAGGSVDNFGTMTAEGGGLIRVMGLAELGHGGDIVNHGGGVIDAAGGGRIVLTAAVDLINAAGGMIKADGGTILITATGSVSNDTGATMEADNGGALAFNAADVINESGATIEAVAGGALQFGFATTFNNAGAVELTDGTLQVGAALTLAGGGTVTLSNNNDNAIESSGTAATLTNVDNTISGAGTIGDAHLTFINDAKGVIDADDATPLVLNTGANTITTMGLFEATGGGTLDIKSAVNNAGGIIEASGSHSAVELFGVTITGGTLETGAGGVIATETGNSTFDNLTIASGSAVEVNAGTSLTLEGTIHNDGTITVAAGADPDLIVSGAVTLDGGGTIVLNGGGDAIVGATGGANSLDNYNTIEGAGDIGNAGVTALTLDNFGTIDADVDGAHLVIETGDNIVQNAGLLEATDGGSLYIDSAVDNTGTILADGDGTGVFAVGGNNQGLMEASDNGVLGINGPGGVANLASGTIEAVGYYSMVIVASSDGSAMENAGQVLALNGGSVSLDCSVDNFGTIKADGGSLLAGTLTNHGGGVIESLDRGSIDFTGGVISNLSDGLIKADDAIISFNFSGGLSNGAGAVMTATDGGFLEFDDLEASFNNAGAVTLDQGTLEVGGSLTLDGGGTVTLSDDSANRIGSNGAPATLTNVDNTISGAGTIGDAQLTFTNEAQGVVDADDDTPLIINTGTNTITNMGLFEATAGGTLEIKSAVNNAGGIIAAFGANSAVELFGVTITGGTLETSAGGVIATETGNSTFDNLTIASGSAVEVNDGTSLTLEGAIENDGTITLAAGTDPDLIVSGAVTLDGGGTIVLNGGGDAIVGAAGGANSLDNHNTIEGAGEIGNGGATALSLVNDGTIDANVADATLTIWTGSTVTNNASLEATCGGTLALRSDVDNRGGVIAAYGADSVVALHGITVIGGTLTTGDPYAGDCGLIEVLACGAATVFDGSCGHAVSIDGFVQVDAGATLELAGTIDLEAGGSNGTIALTQTGSGEAAVGADLQIDGVVHLNGSGAVTLGGSADEITGASCGGTLYNDSSIIGAGSIGVGGTALTLINQACGLIEATGGDAGALVIDTGCNVVCNAGTLEASIGSVLELRSDVDNTCTGIIEAVGSGAIVDLDAVTIAGGTLETSCGGVIEVVCGTSTFDDLSIACDSDVQVEDGAALALQGTIENDGTITLVADSDPDLIIDGCVALNGGGAVVLSGDGDDIIGGCDGGTLHNGSQIVGAGQIGGGDGNLTLINQACGVVDANISGATLALDTGNTVCNTGTLEATGGGILLIEDDVDNDCGTILACGSGSTVRLAAGIDIAGGTLKTGDRSSGCDGMIEILAACGAMVMFDGTAHAVTVDGYVQVDDGARLALDGAIHNDGTITFAACAGAADVVIDGCVSLDGCGAIVLAGSGDAIIGGGEGATLHNASTIAGAGTIGGCGEGLTLINEAGGMINADVCGQTLAVDTGHDASNAGTMAATNGGILAIADNVCNSGLLSASCGGTLDVTAHTITWTGDTADAGCNGIVLDHGTLLVDSCALTLDGGGAVALNGGTIAAAAFGDALYNADTITGTGTIGCGGLVLNNEGCGVIDANACGGKLTLDTGCNTIVNAGILQAENGGTLDIKSAVDNCGGTLVASSLGTVDVESCISGGNAVIAGGTLEFGAASNVNVTFCNGESGTDYGTLVLGDAAHFCGQISGFTGTAGNAANSDTVELAGICETSYCVSSSGGNEILTIYYGDGQHLSLTFDNFNACFTIVDKDGNTYIYDPPVAGGTPGNPAGGAPHDSFGPHGAPGAGGHDSFGPFGGTGLLANGWTQTVATSAAGPAATLLTGVVGAPANATTGGGHDAFGPHGPIGGAHDSFGPHALPGEVGHNSFGPFGGTGVLANGSVETDGSTATAESAATLLTAPVGTALGGGHDAFGPHGPLGGHDSFGPHALPGEGGHNSFGPSGSTGVLANGSVQNDASTATPESAATLLTAPVGTALGGGHDAFGPHGPLGSGHDSFGPHALPGEGGHNSFGPSGGTGVLANGSVQTDISVATAEPAATLLTTASGAPAGTPPTGGHDSFGPHALPGGGGHDFVGPHGGAAPAPTSGWAINFANDQFQTLHAGEPPGGTLGGGQNGANAPAVALATGHDSFVFNTSNTGADASASLHTPAGATEINHGNSVPPADAHLLALLTSDTMPGGGGDTAHHDGIAISPMDQFHQAVASIGHLH